MQRPLRVSLVIPAYNEESHIAACLDAIAAQTVQPFEVIVVDNNSTDNTAAIASSYDFVRLIREPRQGVLYAREAGFNAARGDVIGRTDGDTILSPDWVEAVQRVFVDPQVDAASGLVGYRDIGLRRVFSGIDAWYRHVLARKSGGLHELFLYGVNMAIRKSAWQKVRGTLCHERRFAEDLDLAAHLSQLACSVVFAPSMQATISPRQAAARPREFFKYVWSGPLTYIEHGLRSQRYMYPMAMFVLTMYVPIYVLYKGYDPTRRRFSMVYALRSWSTPPRVSPVSELL